MRGGRERGEREEREGRVREGERVHSSDINQ